MPIITLFFGFLTIFLPLALLGFAFFSFSGILWAVVLSSLISLIFWFIGPQILLHYMNAWRSQKGRARLLLDNMTLHLELEETELYRSRKLPGGVYFLRGMVGKPVIVVGENVESLLSDEELKSLLMAGMLRFRSSLAFCRTVMTLNFFFVAFPLFFTSSTRLSNDGGKTALNILRTLCGITIRFLYSPLYRISEFWMGSTKKHRDFDREVVKQLNNKAEFSSALSKLAEVSANHNFFINLLNNNTSVLTHFNTMDIEFFLESENPLEKRLFYLN